MLYEAHTAINRNSSHICCSLVFQWLTYCFAQLLYIVSGMSMIVVMTCYNLFVKTVIQQSGIWCWSCETAAARITLMLTCLSIPTVLDGFGLVITTQTFLRSHFISQNQILSPKKISHGFCSQCSLNGFKKIRKPHP